MTKSSDKTAVAKVRSGRNAAAMTGSSKSATVLTTSAGSLGPFGYAAGLLIEDVPMDAIQANTQWMTPDAAEVEAARADGTPAVPYRG